MSKSNMNICTRPTLVALLVLVTLSQLGVEAFAAVGRRFCSSSADCGEGQCCAMTPIGYNLCINYEKQGETCFFRSRTPTCGCAAGLKCISTMPMEPGEWNHDYVCARVRPFMHYKLMPYLDDTNEID